MAEEAPLPAGATSRASRDFRIAFGVTSLAVAAMAVDHLLGEDPGLEDPPAFLIASGISIALAAIVFGVVVPRTRAGSSALEHAARRGFACSALALVALPVSLWLGVPFVLAGGGVALGRLGRQGPRKRLAAAALALGAIVLVLGTLAYAYLAVEKLA